jgi:hypothetical protein
LVEVESATHVQAYKSKSIGLQTSALQRMWQKSQIDVIDLAFLSLGHPNKQVIFESTGEVAKTSKSRGRLVFYLILDLNNIDRRLS